MLTKASRYGVVSLLACSVCSLCYATAMAHTAGSGMDARGPWKGYAILGNGNLTVVYSDDPRISAMTHRTGIQHLYFKDYTADYVASTAFDVLDRNDQLVEREAAPAVGMADFFTTQTRLSQKDSGTRTILCFVHPAGAAVLSLRLTGAAGNSRFRFQTTLRKEIKTDREIRLISLQKEDGMAVAVWSNGTALAIAPESPADQVSIDQATISITGTAAGETAGTQALLVPALSAPKAIDKIRALRTEKDLGATANRYWNDWMNRGVLPVSQATTHKLRSISEPINAIFTA